LPGQSALTKRKASLKNGITLAKETIEMLEKLSKKFRVDLPN
jgi:LDH2 family malate/lactate/ureidoglycolate dehydrogenase